MSTSNRPFLCLAVLLGTACSGGGTDTSGSCPAGGMGSLQVTVSGLPAGAGSPVAVSGGAGSAYMVPAGGGTLMLPGGSYRVVARKVVAADPIVRTVYAATVSMSSVCVGPAGAAVSVSYAPVPTSNKLWLANGNAPAQLVAYASASLGQSGAPAASVAATGPGGKAIAFDQDGNLWAFGPTVADAMLNRIPATAFAGSGKKTPDRQINLKGVECVPALSGLAFDLAGNLWVSSACAHAVFRLAAADLSASGDVTPVVKLTGPDAPEGLAFDQDGNLWVGAGSALVRYDAAHLSAGAAAADLTLQAQEKNMAVLAANGLALDRDGNLWADDFGGNVLFRLAPAERQGSGMKTVTPAVRITVPVGALIEGLAFDEGGGLWLTYSMGKFARLSPAQLGVSTDAGMPTVPQTVISSADVGSAAGMAFYPAPPGLFLYGSP